MLCCVTFQVRRFKTSKVKWYALKVKLFAAIVIVVKDFWSYCDLHCTLGRFLEILLSLYSNAELLFITKNACLNTYHFKQKNRKTYTFSLWPPLSHNKSSLIHKIAPLLPSLPQLGPFCMAKNNWKQWLGPWQEFFTRCGIFQRKKTHIYSHLHQPLKTFLSLSASVLKHCCFHLTRHRAGMEATPVWAGRDNVRKLLLCMSLKFGKSSFCLSAGSVNKELGQ